MHAWLQLDLHGMTVKVARRVTEQTLSEVEEDAQPGGVLLEVSTCSMHIKETVFFIETPAMT